MTWVVLTQGQRPDEVRRAIASIRGADAGAEVDTEAGTEVVLVLNGTREPTASIANGTTVVHTDANLGVPGGRHLGVSSTDSEFVGFLDDDAALCTIDAGARVAEYFDAHPDVGAISFRIQDERGEVARRHVPRAGGHGAERPGPAATFLGGAAAVRRTAYDAAGGYWPELFYAHEELDLSWRMHDRGFAVHYVPSIVVEHPRTPISRHADGWLLTGRNRVLIARRNLPLPVAAAHVATWLVLGLVRAPGRTCRSAYLRGWLRGWRGSVDRRPIGWRAVWRLGRAGRPPVI